MSQELKQQFQKRVQEYGCKNEELAVNYFTRLDNELKKMVPVKTWAQINFDGFLEKAVAYANIGIDPLAAKMLSFTLFGNKDTGKSDVVFVEDVRCMEILARKYGVKCPDNITVELIYSTDKFSLIKRDLNNTSDSYILEVTNPFNRGEIIGGVSLSSYPDPTHNKVRLMNMAEIEKRVKTNSPFWTKWKAEMCEKTVGKNAWGKVVLDTTELAEFYAATQDSFVPSDDVEDLPFDPDHEL